MDEIKDRAIHFCIGMLEGIVGRNTGDYSSTVELGIKGIRELIEYWDSTNGGAQFKIGDRVRIKGSNRLEGDIIIDIFKDTQGNYYYEFEGGQEYFADDDWELVPPVDIQPNIKFKVGDLIRHKDEGDSFRILSIEDDSYNLEHNIVVSINSQDSWELAEPMNELGLTNEDYSKAIDECLNDGPVEESSLWHDASERYKLESKYGTELLVEYKGGGCVLSSYRMLYADFENKKIERWITLEELLKL